MRKLIDGLAIASFVLSLTTVGAIGFGYLALTNKTNQEKIKNYAIQSTIRNISSTANLNSDIKYFYVYAPNYFSSLSEEQLNGNNHKNLIGIKHLIGNPVFPPKILEREMYLIEKDYRKTLFIELKRNKKITFFDYSQKAKSTNWFLDYSHFTEFAASKLSSMLAIEILDKED